MQIKNKENIFNSIVDDFIDILGVPYNTVDMEYVRTLWLINDSYKNFKKVLVLYLIELI